MTQDPTRADFEEWYLKYCGDDKASISRELSGDGYDWLCTQRSWSAWQAATKHQSDKCAGLVGALELALKVIDRAFRRTKSIDNQSKYLEATGVIEKALKEHRDSVEGG